MGNQRNQDKGNALSLFVQETFSCLQIPGGAYASEVLRRVFQKKADEAKEILLQELSQGNVSPSKFEEDTLIYMIYRYLRAAQEGTAHNNLRLMAQLISGAKQCEPVSSEDFLYFADIISSLRHDEIRLLALMVREGQNSSYACTKALEKEFGYEYEEIFQALLRTGLVALEQDVSVEDNDDWKIQEKYRTSFSQVYYLTDLWHKFDKYLDFNNLASNKDKI